MISKTTLLLTITVLLAAIFVGASATPAQAAAATASFIRTDNTTQGTWKGIQGADGYSLADSASTNIPSYAAFTPENQANYVWASDTSDVRAPESATSNISTVRLATCWYTGFGTFDLNINFTDGNTHQVALYALDWDNQGRSETIQVRDARSNAVLSTQSISAFTSGTYLIWNISGHVKIDVTRITGPNAVISGIFFQSTTSAGPVSAVANFVSSDTSTEGNWRGVYGADGHLVADDSPAPPAYSSFALENQQNWIWAQDPTDPRAPVTTSGGGRIASTWYNPGNFSFDINLTDGKTHQIALYAMDWDAQGRAESIRITDANTKAVLDSRSIFSFTKGIYLVWNISGHVTISVNGSSGPNAVVSGIFWGTGTANLGTSNTSTQTSTTSTTPTTVSTTPIIVNTSASTTSSSTTSSSSSSSSTSSTTPVTTAKGQLSITPTSFNFGSLNIGSNAAQSFSVTNTGTASVTFSSVTISGAGFNASGLSNGAIIGVGQTATVNVVFTPAAKGQVTGGITLASNASNSSASISLSGTGTQPAPTTYTVDLTWAPSTSSGITGYDIYRGTVSGGPYAMLSSSPQPSTSYTDSNAQGGQTYYYVVTSVDSSNVQSGYSTSVSVTIP